MHVLVYVYDTTNTGVLSSKSSQSSNYSGFSILVWMFKNIHTPFFLFFSFSLLCDKVNNPHSVPSPI